MNRAERRKAQRDRGRRTLEHPPAGTGIAITGDSHHNMVSGNLISGAAVGVFVGGSAHGNTVETSWISADVGVHVAAGAKDNAFNDDDIYGRVGMRLEENTRTRSSKTTIDATGVGIDNAGEFHGPDTQFR